MLKMVINVSGCRMGFYVSLFLLLWQLQSTSAQTDSTNIRSDFKAERPWPIRKFSTRLGTFWAFNNTEIGAGLNGKQYNNFTFENDLNMNRNTYSVLFNLTGRFGRHNRVDFSYYNIYRSAGTTIEKEIQFGEHVYPVNSDINAHLNTNIFRLSYGYSFISSKKLDFGALIGFHVMAFDMGLDLNGETLDLSYKDNVSFTAPLPDIGFYGTYAFNDRWAINAELSYFYLQYKTLKGRILNASLSAQYRLSNHWDVALGYTGFDVDVDLDTKRLNADFNWKYSGPFVNVAYKFGK